MSLDDRLEKHGWIVTPNNCHEWLGYRNEFGYGMMGYGGGAPKIVTRIIMSDKLGRPLTSTEIVRHTCDNPPCINPAHLVIGTSQDNSIDCVMRGRHPSAKLNPEAVRDIRARYNKKNIQELASQYGVGKYYISKVVSGKVWGYVS